MRTLIALCLALCLSFPALAQEKKADVPFREDAGLISAEYYIATEKYTEALQVLGGVLKRHPVNADAYTYRGYAYEQLGDLKKARENYNRALQINAKHLGANRYLAGLYLKKGKLAQAMEQLEAIRVICAGTDCAEEDELAAAINRFKKGE